MATKKRTYTSSLRAQQAEDTRERILEAALKLIGEGAHRLTIPNVAKEAGVAVPTVYRHFATKEELEDAVADHVRNLVRVQTAFEGIDELVARMRELFAAFAGHPPGTIAVLLASVARNLERPRPERLSYVRDGLASELEGLSPEDAERIVLVAAALGSSPGALALMRLGLTSDESADVVEWALNALVRASR